MHLGGCLNARNAFKLWLGNVSNCIKNVFLENNFIVFDEALQKNKIKSRLQSAVVQNKKSLLIVY